MEPALRSRYRVYICTECGEQNQYAGFCDRCNVRLAFYTCIPIEKILAARDEFIENSSPVPQVFIEKFVEDLLRLE